MSRAKYIYPFLVFIIFSGCATTNETPTTSMLKPINLLISTDDMPAGWKSFEVFSDEYDDQCYIDCAMIQFSPVEENKVYSEESVYMYNTVEEAERNYEELLSTVGTTPSDWSYYSDTANQFDISCYTHKSKSFPSCTWIAQYDKYLVEFYAELLPDRLSLSDFEKILDRIDLKMKVVAKQGQ